MKSIYIFLFFVISCVGTVKSQFNVSRLEFGGIFGGSFGNHSTSIKINPQVGYAFTNNFSAGVGIGYAYYDYYDISENYAGLNLYARFRPVKYIMLQAQPELYRTWGTYKSELVPTFLLGGGVIMPMGSLGGISFSLFYDVIQNNRSPYSNNLVYSVGYVFGF